MKRNKDKNGKEKRNGVRICYSFNEEFSKFINEIEKYYTVLQVTHDGYRKLRGGAKIFYEFASRWKTYGKRYRGLIENDYTWLGFKEIPTDLKLFNKQMKRNIKQINDKTELTVEFDYEACNNSPYSYTLKVVEDDRFAPQEIGLNLIDIDDEKVRSELHEILGG